MKVDSQIACDKMIQALNHHLPDDISVTDCREVPIDFHARYDCLGKEYIYRILNSRVKDPFSPHLRYRIGYNLDAEFLNTQASDFIGRHDFAAFCSSKSKVQDTVRTIEIASVCRIGDEVRFTVRGDGFLYNMVRIMAGTLINIADGHIKAGSIPEIIASRDRNMAGRTMPAEGLYLSRIFYGENIWKNR